MVWVKEGGLEEDSESDLKREPDRKLESKPGKGSEGDLKGSLKGGMDSNLEFGLEFGLKPVLEYNLNFDLDSGLEREPEGKPSINPLKYPFRDFTNSSIPVACRYQENSNLRR